MITIGQLAQYVGVSTKTIRVYHEKGLLPEPPRDASGYRRYTAQDLVELIKIRTLAEAGLPLAGIAKLSAGSAAELQAAAEAAESDLTARIATLVRTRSRLRDLAAGNNPFLPGDVEQHLRRLHGLGFSDRWIAMERDLWILTFATDPATAHRYFTDQAEAQADPVLGRLYLDCDRAHDLSPDDPALDELAERIVDASLARYPADELREQLADAALPQLVQSSVNSSAPAWERLDALIRTGLSRRVPRGGSGGSARRGAGPRG
ncbi:DNA-binding transcriptional MerR regulator [Kribbella aluminosa]|uniref:DNA-binding transcriptional MerR regulator n=1 Tax=Kribbella aluminosa TaxID=416017 RepID=A0ABS4UND2_9ACTN|nr:MerR family transcriptional regulator [Kribbella aluminosa]MBP2353147.1 DNA-binding transcriptional MerR regulator [Kribbella aluminosa]